MISSDRPDRLQPKPTLLQPPGRLRLALVAPPWYAVPPTDYGGIERVVYLLGRELTRRGHDVTTFGRQGESEDLPVRQTAEATWLSDLGGPDQAVRMEAYLTRVHRVLRAGSYDLVHDHNSTSGLAVALAAGFGGRLMATLHGPVRQAQADFLAEVDQEVDLIAISRAQQAGSQGLRWRAMIHNAVPVDELEFSAEDDGYLVQLARISPEKGQHVSIQVAREAGLPLVLAGKVGEDHESTEYFERHVRPALGDGVTWLREVGGSGKARLLARARAMLFPVQWEEPFGIAVIEAMASGTPVLATARGAMPELIEPGVGGFLGACAEDLGALLPLLGEVDRALCAAWARRRFSPEAMAERYEAAYLAALREDAIA